MKLLFTKDAVADLARLRAFIADNPPHAAKRTADDLRKGIQSLREFPMRGKPVPHAPVPEAIRDMVRGEYVVRYLVQKEALTILRVLHGKEHGR
ncbi:MAG: type II toxin-antitoxin system RelE/ParE family toxin [Magnetococcales bacterium]|nr:type II toxin-antitoxin system RelE/ParE family toxin [Magnetococcales bacterium]